MVDEEVITAFKEHKQLQTRVKERLGTTYQYASLLKKYTIEDHTYNFGGTNTYDANKM